MALFGIPRTGSAVTKVAIAGATTLAALALGNHLAARRAERRHPPGGAFMHVDGVRLHYSDRGEGSPVVLIHGKAVSGSDWNTSGVAELLLQGHRTIIVYRPGFGYSEPPRGHLLPAAH